MLCLVGSVALPAILHTGYAQLFGLAGKAEAAGVLGGVGIHIGFELFEGAVQKGHIRLGGVVLILHAGAADDRALRQLLEDGLGDFHFLAQRTLEVFQRDVAGAEQSGLFAHHRHDGGLHAPVALAAVQNEGQAAIHVGKDVLCVGGAGLAGEVGRRGRKGAAAGFNDSPCHRVAGHPDAHSVQTGTALRCHLGAAGHDDGQRAGTERPHQQLGAFRHLADEAVQHLRAGDVDDEGIVLRASLRHKDLAHGLAVAGVGRDAVDRLGRQGYQLALPQKLGCAGNALCVSRADFSIDTHTNHRSFLL